MIDYPCEYRSKHIVLFVNRASYAPDSLISVLTFAVGMAGGLSDHSLDIVFIGDGVTECLASQLTEAAVPYMTSAKSRGVGFWADKYSLEIRGMLEDSLFSGCAVISPEELADLIKKSNMHLRL
ncbi:MAG: DsrE family protein [Candidatus Bruticola sp.]